MTIQPKLDSARTVLDRLYQNLNRVLYGQERKLQWLLAAFGAGGHVLLEDVPGTGKTTLAKTLAMSCEAEFQRIQFTPDLLPSDILGMSIYDQQQQAFRFEPGPIFCQILLADEINRASPRTQSALLEAMAENQVSIERNIHALADPFFVIATQNPVEYHGTYPLPEAQLDRFAMQFSLGYVDAQQEVRILDAFNTGDAKTRVESCAGIDDILALRSAVSAVRISEELKHYIVALVAATRSSSELTLGASPRASLTLMRCAQALAIIDGSDFVTPDIIHELAPPVIAHRVSVAAQSRFSGADGLSVVNGILQQVPIPV